MSIRRRNAGSIRQRIERGRERLWRLPNRHRFGRRWDAIRIARHISRRSVGVARRFRIPFLLPAQDWSAWTVAGANGPRGKVVASGVGKLVQCRQSAAESMAGDKKKW